MASLSEANYVLCFATDGQGQLFVDADAAGLDFLIGVLSSIRKDIDRDVCEHDHLISRLWGGDELTELVGCNQQVELIHHVKICGWTEEWAQKLGFKV